jgi:hypothetical protein
MNGGSVGSGCHEKSNKSNSTNFSGKSLESAFKKVSEFSKNEELRNLDFPLVKNIYTNIDNVLNKLNITSHDFTPKDASAEMLRRILFKKSISKPGFGNYIVNVDSKGKIKYHQITEEKIKNLSSDDLNDYVSVNQSALNIFPDKLLQK